MNEKIFIISGNPPWIHPAPLCVFNQKPNTRVYTSMDEASKLTTCSLVSTAPKPLIFQKDQKFLALSCGWWIFSIWVLLYLIQSGFLHSSPESSHGNISFMYKLILVRDCAFGNSCPFDLAVKYNHTTWKFHFVSYFT